MKNTYGCMVNGRMESSSDVISMLDDEKDLHDLHCIHWCHIHQDVALRDHAGNDTIFMQHNARWHSLT
jgi:hypothetical protein